MKNIINKFAVVFLLNIFFIAASLAQNASFTSSVSKNPVSVGERIQVSFTLSNANGSNFKAPSFKGFSVLSGPNQSQNMSFSNGQTNSSLAISYILQADSPGKLTIGEATIAANGKVLKTNPVTITVEKGATNNQQGANQGQKNENAQADEIIKKNFYLKLITSKNSVYQGEQFIATYKLYAHPDLQIVGLDFPKMPAFNGFWAQDAETIKSLEWKVENVNGVRFRVADIKKVVLFPQQNGRLPLDNIEVNCTVRLRVQRQQQRSRDPFEDFFNDPFMGGGYRDFKHITKSNAVTINVIPLPESAPSEFHGSVGDMQLRAWFDKTETKTNEPVTLKVQISGKGNLKLLDPINIKVPPDFELYDPKIVDNLNVSSAGISGNKTFEYLINPRNVGKYEIEPVKFAYFDYDKKRYITLSSEKFVIKVDQGSANSSSTFFSGVRKEEVKYLGKDIQFIKISSNSFKHKGEFFFGNWLFYLLSFTAPALFIFIIFYRRKQIEENRNQALLKNRRANKVIRRRLAKAAEFMKKNDNIHFHEELSHALWTYMSDKLSIPFAELTKDNARTKLEHKLVDGNMINDVLSILDECEFARFAPAGYDVSMSDIYDKTAKIIVNLEGVLKS
ncbi:MAG: BatD family protein [Candidatus Kapabacteria bacterium]|nr:BatD family protein [Candidatus Kapabacteria bacterium]